MAYRFDASTDGLSITSNVLDYTQPWSAAYWFYISTDTNAYTNVFSIHRNAVASNAFDYIGMSGSGTATVLLIGSGGGFTETAGSNLSVGVWYHAMVIRDSTSSIKLYYNGSTTADATNTRNTAGRDPSTRMDIAAYASTNDDRFDGRFTGLKIWNTALPIREIRQEYLSFEPVRKANLWAWYPLRQVGDPFDHSGGGHHWTEDGTLASEIGPPVQQEYPIRIEWLTVPSGGTNYTQSVSGTLTTAGALIKQDSKILAGTLTSSGALIKQASKILTGAFTPSGALTKQSAKSFAGTLTSAGALANQTGKLLSGAVSSSGALVNQPGKALGGTVSSSGAITRAVRTSESATVDFTGALGAIKTALVSVGGTLSSTGALVKQVGKSLSGALTSSGIITKAIRTSASATVDFSGALGAIKTVLVSMSGTLTTAGALSRQVNKTLTGTLTSTGEITKLIRTSMSATVDFSGVLSGARIVLVAVAGTLASSGALTRNISKMITGILSFAGLLSSDHTGGGMPAVPPTPSGHPGIGTRGGPNVGARGNGSRVGARVGAGINVGRRRR